MKTRQLYSASLAALILAACGAASYGRAQQALAPTIPLKESKLIIEHNATDHDTGFQGAIDSEGWKELTITGPTGEKVVSFEGEGRMRRLGLTELFFETVEPKNEDVPIQKLLKILPEGTYRFAGPAIDTLGRATVGFAKFTHTIPAGPVLVSPPEDAKVPADVLPIRWKPVTKTIDGKPVKIIAYQLIVEKNGLPAPNMIGKPNSLSMYLPPTVTHINVPRGFLEPGAAYDWEVLAIEPSGNQTLSSSSFETE